jgi:hypothetical protein
MIILNFSTIPQSTLQILTAMLEKVIEIPYNHGIYHAATKPSFSDAQAAFSASNAQQAINTIIRDCFLKHKVEKLFSACVIHRHFDLNPDECNIEERGRAVASRNLDNIQPCSWLFYKGKLFAYEFKRVNYGLPIPPPEFVAELGSILEAERLCDIIGIQLYMDGLVGVESTDHEARVSTTVNYSENEVNNDQDGSASFAFF